MFVAGSVGYDTFKLYHDTDTDTFSEKYHDTDTWYIYKKSIMILVHFKCIMIPDTLLILLKTHP